FGSRMSAGEREPKEARKPITVVGTNCMPVAFTTNSIAPARESFSPFSVSCIAEIADGVAAFPTPRRLDASFNEMYCFATSDTLPYKKLLTGFRQRDSFSTRRHCSTTLKMPIHRQYTPHSPNAVV